jgi:hypothetical protein
MIAHNNYYVLFPVLKDWFTASGFINVLARVLFVRWSCEVPACEAARVKTRAFVFKFN